MNNADKTITVPLQLVIDAYYLMCAVRQEDDYITNGLTGFDETLQTLETVIREARQ